MTNANRKVALPSIIFILFVLSAQHVIGQSTTPWIWIGTSPGSPKNFVQNPRLGATYVTAAFLAGTVYQKSNWWTNIVEGDRQAVLDVSVTGRIGNTNIGETKTGTAIELKKNDAMVDLGYSGIVLQRIPTTFQSLQLTVGISKTANDELQGLINILSDLSKTNPAISVSASSLGIVSATKSFADYLFGKHLLERKLQSTTPVPGTGSSLKGGVYVCLAGDNQDDYAHYLTTPTSGKGLSWENSQLTWNGSRVQRISYFVMEIDYQDSVFENPIDALSFSPLKPWAALYVVGRDKVSSIVDSASGMRIVAEIRSHTIDAQTLLNADPDYVISEKDKLIRSLSMDIQNRIVDRLSTRGIITNASTAKPVPPAEKMTSSDPIHGQTLGNPSSIFDLDIRYGAPPKKDPLPPTDDDSKKPPKVFDKKP